MNFLTLQYIHVIVFILYLIIECLPELNIWIKDFRLSSRDFLKYLWALIENKDRDRAISDV